MIILSNIAGTAPRKLQVVLAAAHATTAPSFVASYVDVTTTTYVPGASTGVFNGVTPVDAVAAPAAGAQRQIKFLDVWNADTAAVTASIVYNDNGTSRTLVKVALQPGSHLQYTDGEGWRAFDASGGLVLPSGGAVAAIERGGGVWSSELPPIAAALTGNAVGYWLYMGRTTRQITANFVELALTVVGAGAQTAELGLFSTPVGPNRAAQSLSKLVATATVDTLTVGTGVKRNTADFATAIAAGVHVWAGVRVTMVTTQPTITGLTLDMAEGRALTVAAPGAINGAGPFAGQIIAHAVTWQLPDLRFVFT